MHRRMNKSFECCCHNLDGVIQFFHFRLQPAPRLTLLRFLFLGDVCSFFSVSSEHVLSGFFFPFGTVHSAADRRSHWQITRLAAISFNGIFGPCQFSGNNAFFFRVRNNFRFGINVAASEGTASSHFLTRNSLEEGNQVKYGQEEGR